MQRGRPVSREQLATLLWGNSATEQARQSLRQCLAALRNTLGAEASEPIVADTASVLLAPSDRWAIDVAAFEAACQSKGVADLERASTLCRDEFLAGLQIAVEPFNDWLTLERQRLTSLRLDLLQRLAQARAEAGDTEGAIAAARQLNALDPLREDGHRLLMRLLAASGNRSCCAQAVRALRAHPARGARHRPRRGDRAAGRSDPRRPANVFGVERGGNARSNSTGGRRGDFVGIDRPAASRQALDRRSSLRQPQRRCKPGLLRRRAGGGHHRRARPRDLAVRHRQPVRLRLAGTALPIRARSRQSWASAMC